MFYPHECRFPLSLQEMDFYRQGGNVHQTPPEVSGPKYLMEEAQKEMASRAIGWLQKTP